MGELAQSDAARSLCGLRGEMAPSVGLLMLKMQCVGERDAVDGTLGGWQFGRG